jgi:putative addiction module CopG family antidote
MDASGRRCDAAWHHSGTDVVKLEQVTLTAEAARFAEAQVVAGRFRTIDEALNAAMEALQQQMELEAVHAALDDGEASGLADDGVFARIRSRLGLPQP